MKMKSVAAGAAIAGALGLGALGIGAGVANAAPPGAGFAQDWGGHGHGWGGPGPGPGWGGPGPGPGWGGPGWVPGPEQALGLAGDNAEQQLGEAGYGVLNGIGCLLGGC
jgi:hypothetical protein